jgi:hypothetical protein
VYHDDAEAMRRPLHQYVSERPALAEVVVRNHRNVESVHEWITRDEWANSFFNYGVPAHILDALPKPVGAAPCQSDLISWLGTQLRVPVHYLEIGVSVGKTFYIQTQAFGAGAVFTAFDIEYINPTLQRLLTSPNGRFGQPQLVTEWKEQVGRDRLLCALALAAW